MESCSIDILTEISAVHFRRLTTMWEHQLPREVHSRHLFVGTSPSCEAATVTNAQVILTDDERFIQNMIKYQPVYHCLIKAIERVFNL